jgi:hypothetical protein
VLEYCANLELHPASAGLGVLFTEGNDDNEGKTNGRLSSLFFILVLRFLC